MGNIVILNSYRYPLPPLPCDVYYNQTKLLLNFDGVDGATTTTDASLSAHTPTFGGTAQLDTAITKFGPSSLLLDGDSDYVDIPLSTDFDFATNPFTIELHFRLDTLAKRHAIITKYGSTLSNTADWALVYETSGTYGDVRDNHLRFLWTTDGATIQNHYLTTGTIATDTWYHVAVCRDDTIPDGLSVFLDGVKLTPLIGLSSAIGDDIFYSSEPIHIGKIDPAAGDKLYLDGNVDNVRITKSVARYGLPEQAFTPPTSAHPTDIGGDPLFNSVTLLASFDGTDGATTYTSEDNGAQTATFSSSAQLDTAVKKYGTAALLVTGSTDLVEFPDSDGYAFGTGDFTVECWCYPTANPTDDTLVASLGSTGEYGWGFRTIVGGLQFFWSLDGSTTVYAVTSQWLPPLNEWSHVAVCREGDIISLFGNGVQVASVHMFTYNTINDAAWPLTIGNRTATWWGRAMPFTGSIDDVRITKGVARYTNSAQQFTPPAEAFASTACVIEGDLPLIEDYTTVIQEVTDWENGQTWNNFWGWGWKPDGTKFVTVNNSNDRIYGFDFGTAFDFTTTSNNSANPGQTVQVVGLDVMFNEDGTKYSTWSWFSANTMVTYNAATPYEPKTTDTQISSANFGSYSSSDSESYWIDRSGVHLFIITVGNSPDKIIHFKMSTPWDVTTAVLQSDEFNIDTGGYSSNSRMYMSPTGRDLIFSHSGSATPLWQFRMSDPYNLNTMVEISQLDITAFGPRGGGVWMSEDTTKLILGPGANDSYDIQVRIVPITPTGGPNLPDLTTTAIVLDSTFGADAGELEMDELTGLDFSPDGLKMWIHQDYDLAVPKVIEYDLSPAWDITSATQNSVSAQTNDYSVTRLANCQWSDDGTSIFFPEYNTGWVAKIDVSTPYTMDWSAIPTPDQRFDASAQFAASRVVGIHIFNDGRNMFLAGTNDVIARYFLSTPWDITTAFIQSQGSTISMSGTTQSPLVSDDGLRVWACSNSAIAQWDLTTPFDMTEVTGNPDAEAPGLTVAGSSGPKQMYVPEGRNEVYVGWYGTTPINTFVEKYTWSDPADDVFMVGTGAPVIRNYNDSPVPENVPIPAHEIGDLLVVYSTGIQSPGVQPTESGWTVLVAPNGSHLSTRIATTTSHTWTAPTAGVDGGIWQSAVFRSNIGVPTYDTSNATYGTFGSTLQVNSITAPTYAHLDIAMYWRGIFSTNASPTISNNLAGYTEVAANANTFNGTTHWMGFSYKFTQVGSATEQTNQTYTPSPVNATQGTRIARFKFV